MSLEKTELCPCKSGRIYGECCGMYHAGTIAPTCEALMRSRYSAFSLGLNDYILRTWHPNTRPDADELGGLDLHWIGLEIVSTALGSEKDIEGKVRFIASYVAKKSGKKLEELSDFVKEGGQWLYLSGACTVSDIARNESCPCGSGLKFKRCCLG